MNEFEAVIKPGPVSLPNNKNKKKPKKITFLRLFCNFSRFIRSGSDLLSHDLSHSTIDAALFHGRVRDGNVWDQCAITTRPYKTAVR